MPHLEDLGTYFASAYAQPCVWAASCTPTLLIGIHNPCCSKFISGVFAPPPAHRLALNTMTSIDLLCYQFFCHECNGSIESLCLTFMSFIQWNKAAPVGKRKAGQGSTKNLSCAALRQLSELPTNWGSAARLPV